MKDEARRRARAVRDGLDAARRRAGSDVIQGHILGWPVYASARTLLLYRATGSEVETDAILADALRTGKRVAVPRVAPAHPLDTVLVAADTRWRRGAFGVLEPDGPAVRLSWDLVLVPGLAFDRRGHRLGYGGGHFDALLRSLPPRHAAGLAFDECVVEALPTHEGDVAVDWIITPAGVKARRP